MKLRFALLVLCWLAVSALCHAAPPPGYYLQWSDEFNGNALNTNIWNYNLSQRDSGYNTLAAVSVTNGFLTITTYTANGTNYTGFINTSNKVMTGYGYYEASIQFSNAPGTESAFWMESRYISNTNNSPTNGVEIDIFEHRDVDGSGNYWANGGDSALHWDGYGAFEQGSSWTSNNLGLGSGFHTYGLLWTTKSYTFYVDGNVTWTTNYLVSSAPEYILLTSDVENDNFVGKVPTGGYGSLATSTQQMLVDYVRYYVMLPTLPAKITGVTSSNGKLVITGTNLNGGGNFHYAVLTSTNLAAPLANWTALSTNSFNENGTFDYTNSINTTNPAAFFDVMAVP